MGIFTHILVPVDFTEKNSPALETAKTLATQNNARITLLHVVETIEYVVGEEVEGFYDRLKTSSRDRLHELSPTVSPGRRGSRRKDGHGETGPRHHHVRCPKRC